MLRPVYERDRRGATATSAWRCRRRWPSTRAATLEEARRLWKAVGRENLMIKVPATPAGHRRASAADRRGDQRQRHAAVRARDVRARSPRPTSRGSSAASRGGGDPSRVASVASFFVSRIDTAVDVVIAERLARGPRPRASTRCCARWRARWRSPTPSWPTSATRRSSPGRAGRRWPTRGAQTQRLLWASTGAQEPQLLATWSTSRS